MEPDRGLGGHRLGRDHHHPLRASDRQPHHVAQLQLHDRGGRGRPCLRQDLLARERSEVVHRAARPRRRAALEAIEANLEHRRASSRAPSDSARDEPGRARSSHGSSPCSDRGSGPSRSTTTTTRLDASWSWPARCRDSSTSRASKQTTASGSRSSPSRRWRPNGPGATIPNTAPRSRLGRDRLYASYDITVSEVIGEHHFSRPRYDGLVPARAPAPGPSRGW